MISSNRSVLLASLCSAFLVALNSVDAFVVLPQSASSSSTSHRSAIVSPIFPLLAVGNRVNSNTNNNNNNKSSPRARELEQRINNLERERGSLSQPRTRFNSGTYNNGGNGNSYNSGSSAFDFGTRSAAASSRSRRESLYSWETARKVEVQGDSLKTFSFEHPVDRVQVALTTQGRELEANVELWQGPGNIPVSMKVYVEDGGDRPFNCVLETPGCPNTVAVRNIASLEFPMEARVLADTGEIPVDAPTVRDPPMQIQGGALTTIPFDYTVDQVQIMLETDGRPLNARIELLQGPNNNKQVIDLYTEDGQWRPFFVILETPGAGNVVRVVNTASMEFPLTAWVEPYRINGSTMPSNGSRRRNNSSNNNNNDYGGNNNSNNGRRGRFGGSTSFTNDRYGGSEFSGGNNRGGGGSGGNRGGNWYDADRGGYGGGGGGYGGNRGGYGGW